METRRGSGMRLEAPYSLEIETPHVKWANPFRAAQFACWRFPPWMKAGLSWSSPSDFRWTSRL